MYDFEPVEFDFDGDGIVDATAMPLDMDGDGYQDGTAVALDTDGNGMADTVNMDLDGDGYTDVSALDQNGDGEMDITLVDLDGDGIEDLAAVDILLQHGCAEAGPPGINGGGKPRGAGADDDDIVFHMAYTSLLGMFPLYWLFSAKYSTYGTFWQPITHFFSALNCMKKSRKPP